MNAMLFRACRLDSEGSFLSAAASRPWILEKSNPSKVFGYFCGSLLSLSSISIVAS